MENEQKADRQSERQFLPLEEFEPLLNKLRELTNCSLNEALRAVGYAGGTHWSDWQRKKTVPLLAMNAIKWVLYDYARIDSGPSKTSFTLDEQTDVLLLMRGFPIKEENRRAIIKKIAAALASQ